MTPSENADLTVLVVDDDEPSRYSTRRVIQEAGYKALEAASGEQALEVASHVRSDLIILDVRLPGISGWEVCKRLKADPSTSAIPIIHLSSTYVDAPSIAAGLEGGADAYLIQPVDSLVLVATVRALLRARRAEKALQQSEARAREDAARLRAVLDAAPAIIWTALDADCLTIVGNRTAYEFSRVPVGGNLSKTGPEAERLGHYRMLRDGVELRPQEMPIQVVARSGRALLNYAVDFVFDDATKRTVVGNIVPVLDADGRPGGAVAAFVDITERRQAEQERERLQAEVLAAERARAELAENLNRETSHRTKNNLAMVAGLLQMQMAESRKPEVSAALREATGRVLAFATLHEQLQSGLGDEADVLGLVRRIANVTSGIFAFRSVALSVQGHPAVCPRGVATNLAVVANELITNAIKHGAPGPEGEQEVKVRVAPEDGELRLSVWNSGPPVPAGFDPTAQPGLGLRLVWSIVVEQYGGSFTLRPHEGGSLAQLTVGDPCLPEQETSGPGLPPG